MINKDFNYHSMVAVIYRDPIVNLNVWEELWKINHGKELYWSPEDYILIPFPIFHNYQSVVQRNKPDDIMEYNSSLEEYSSIVADPIIMKVLEDYDLISAFVGVDWEGGKRDYIVITDGKYPATIFTTNLYKVYLDRVDCGEPLVSSPFPINYGDLSLELRADFVRKFISVRL